MVFTPMLRLSALEALPEMTIVPLTLIVAPGCVVVGVMVSDVTLLATVAL
jgi:hypothetical protein